MSKLKIAVIGGGNIGSSLAFDCALWGHDVVVIEKDALSCEQSRERITETAGYAPLFSPLAKGKTPEEMLLNIVWSQDLQAVSDCAFVVENITENIELKQSLYARMSEFVAPDAVLAANTSCIPITKLGSFHKTPSQVIGVHFMNPVYLKHTVEVIVGLNTSEQTKDRCLESLGMLGKKAVVVKDGPGFVSNRISHLFMNEAAFTIQDGIAQPADVDAIFKECFGHKMGLLETADLIGIDTVVNSLDVLYQMFQDSKYRVCPLMRTMVDAGHLGRKSGRGFYTY
ncbi:MULTISPECIES: 3-hydroxyacyl-CoA dehydrogenase family protein [Photorhabdus]|uniref:3-hydroxyacyl-coa dehydrogenase n=2 Tax=Photorhabdus asymbiotica TaxID=291112 RepID=B6VL22_PHOAA|nr:3-hydroxyacyl-CoA dehydrogenase family protein [Photorhabdus asymbiotica]RKS57098.1 3-hydroxybutyryl-CoA dehydrogenase [Photorhabdus asymbiotica]CAQ84546.1 putative 3-hydroxyacyl-coa dehydrogenase [Photorhabdus asymbiotica]CAR66852.1 putative 3-hydroxyacyl-coa dehydrogenase [Photorhabdus asymbiotica subsp. asymbiotica ATCC 43949]